MPHPYPYNLISAGSQCPRCKLRAFPPLFTQRKDFQILKLRIRCVNKWTGYKENAFLYNSNLCWWGNLIPVKQCRAAFKCCRIYNCIMHSPWKPRFQQVTYKWKACKLKTKSYRRTFPKSGEYNHIFQWTSLYAFTILGILFSFRFCWRWRYKSALFRKVHKKSKR